MSGDAGDQPTEPSARRLDSHDLTPGTLVGSYAVVSRIGTGGCSTVYRVTHVALGRTAALKVMNPQLATSPNAVKRFVREARASTVIGHPNIIDIYDLGQLEGGPPYYVMEYIDGPNLDQWVRSRDRLSPAEALELIAPVCDALACAHKAGVLHRDIKPSNVVVAMRDERRVVKLIDFGVAKLVDRQEGEALTSEGQRLGTPVAMAPEQIRAEVIDARADVYALGVTLFYLLTARYPFEGSRATDLERQHLSSPPPRPGAFAPVSRAIDEVVARALAKDRNDRYPDVQSFAAALREAVGVAAPPAARRTPALGIYVEAAPRAEMPDDAVIDAADDLLAEAGRALTAAGCVVCLRTANCLVAVRSLEPGGPADARTAAVDQVTALHRRMSLTAAGRVVIRVCVSAGEVELTETAGGTRATGSLASIDWVPRDLPEGVTTT